MISCGLQTAKILLFVEILPLPLLIVMENYQIAYSYNRERNLTFL